MHNILSPLQQFCDVFSFYFFFLLFSVQHGFSLTFHHVVLSLALVQQYPIQMMFCCSYSCNVQFGHNVQRYHWKLLQISHFLLFIHCIHSYINSWYIQEHNKNNLQLSIETLYVGFTIEMQMCVYNVHKRSCLHRLLSFIVQCFQYSCRCIWHFQFWSK